MGFGWIKGWMETNLPVRSTLAGTDQWTYFLLEFLFHVERNPFLVLRIEKFGTELTIRAENGQISEWQVTLDKK